MIELRAMDTRVSVYAPTLAAEDEAAAAATVAALFEAAEARFSRFRPDSELARLNRATGAIAVSPVMLAALARARGYVELTRGRFDPAVGGALAAAGYDRSFAAGALDHDDQPTQPRPARFAEVTLDLERGVVDRPPHVQLDLGGMIKGATVDLAARQLPAVAALDAGGDVVLRGAGPDGDGWLIEVEDPIDPARTLVTLVVRDRAVATSAANRRRWRRGDRWAHHLIDPATGAPATSDLAQVTVVAACAERAEVLAKAVFVAGAQAGRALLAATADVAAVLVHVDGTVELVGPLEVHHDA
ncbi:MAG: FAD:protein FMN transferase [Myxococcales bacterium]|nr:FAD:protein FMN transferase [Myxococcales bacterium]